MTTAQPVRFLVDADLPRACVPLAARFGYEAVHVHDLGLAAAPDTAIAARARDEQRAIITGDFDFSDVRAFPPDRHHGILVLTIRPDATRETILSMLSEVLAQPAIISQLPGRLAIVEFGRVRLHPRLAV